MRGGWVGREKGWIKNFAVQNIFFLVFNIALKIEGFSFKLKIGVVMGGESMWVSEREKAEFG